MNNNESAEEQARRRAFPVRETVIYQPSTAGPPLSEAEIKQLLAQGRGQGAGIGTSAGDFAGARRSGSTRRKGKRS